jgi:mannose-6-phosphate isomerase-like protein (cupin superfamily)
LPSRDGPLFANASLDDPFGHKGIIGDVSWVVRSIGQDENEGFGLFWIIGTSPWYNIRRADEVLLVWDGCIFVDVGGARAQVGVADFLVIPALAPRRITAMSSTKVARMIVTGSATAFSDQLQ